MRCGGEVATTRTRATTDRRANCGCAYSTTCAGDCRSEVFGIVPQEHESERICEQIVDVPVPQVVEQLILAPPTTEEIAAGVHLTRFERGQERLEEQSVDILEKTRQLSSSHIVRSKTRIAEHSVHIPVSPIEDQITDAPVL